MPMDSVVEYRLPRGAGTRAEEVALAFQLHVDSVTLFPPADTGELSPACRCNLNLPAAISPIEWQDLVANLPRPCVGVPKSCKLNVGLAAGQLDVAGLVARGVSYLAACAAVESWEALVKEGGDLLHGDDPKDLLHNGIFNDELAEMGIFRCIPTRIDWGRPRVSSTAPASTSGPLEGELAMMRTGIPLGLHRYRH